MALCGMRLWWLAAMLLLWSQGTQCRNVTHEDIRDAMLSLVHMFRASEEKLERHEFREKTLGDQLKKMINNLDKKQRGLEPLKGVISRLDERLSNVETILLQKEEREKKTQQKTTEMLEAIQRSLQTLTDNVNKQKRSGTSVVENNLTTNDDGLARRLDDTDLKLTTITQEIQTLRSSLSKDFEAACSAVASGANPLQKHISDAEKLLNKYELKLNEYNGTSSKPVPTDFVPLSEVSLADDAWHGKMTEVMERQEKEIKSIQKMLSEAEPIWKELPKISDLHTATNQTLEAVEDAKTTLKESDESSVTRMVGKLRELSDKLAATNVDIQQSLTQGNTMSERAYNDITRHYDTLRTEVQALSKNEHVLVQTADNVIATKKRVEYGVHQILLEVGELVRNHATALNSSFADRFTSIEASILGQQSGALANLTDKIESEMSQVWRQIGIMYQQLAASKTALDKLTEQTDQYVNGTTTALDGMKDKVTTITKRMSELDENLNYLLGRLALVSQEFVLIKTGLGDALDKAKANLHSVQDKIQDSGPGPHAISSAELPPAH